MTRAELLGLPDHVEAGHRRPPGVRLEQGREDPDGRGLAGAVRAEQAQHRALLDGQVDAVEGADLGLAGAVDLDEAFGRDRSGHASLSRPRRSVGWGSHEYIGDSRRVLRGASSAGRSDRPATLAARP